MRVREFLLHWHSDLPNQLPKLAPQMEGGPCVVRHNLDKGHRRQIKSRGDSGVCVEDRKEELDKGNEKMPQ